MTNNEQLIERAKKMGVNRSVTDNDIKLRYDIEYQEFLNNSFKGFVSFLIEKKNCKDPDILYRYGVFLCKDEIINKAKNDGADENITFNSVIKRYETEFLEYLKSL